ncbi:MAG TPA: GspE/PulE family protein [Planctomycetota bacterium]
MPNSLLRGLLQMRPLSAADIDDLLQATLRQCAEALGAQAVVLLQACSPGRMQIRGVWFDLGRHAKHLTPKASGAKGMNGGGIHEESVAKLHGQLIPMSQTIAGRVIEAGEPMTIADPEQFLVYRDPIEWPEGFQLRSMLAVPLRAAAKPVGCILAVNHHRRGGEMTGFHESQLKLLEDAARYVSKAILHASANKPQLSEDESADCLARLANCALHPASEVLAADGHLCEEIGERTIKRCEIVPLEWLAEDSIRAAMANPLDYLRLDDFELLTDLKVVQKVVATPAAIKAAIQKVFPDPSKVAVAVEAALQEGQVPEPQDADTRARDMAEEDSALIALTHRIIEEGFQEGASDIHIEPTADKVVLRYRKDGLCHVKTTLPKGVHRSLISRLKIMAALDIAEHRLPQDGRISYSRFSSKFELDLRLSIVPSSYGESAVMRILDKRKSALPLDALGFSTRNIEVYRELIRSPYGMILHCGPTGSGKSMTLFAALQEVKSPEVKILTAEDPIEYTSEGITQLQVHKSIGLTFASALRSFLRQDPDIVLVGEVRDRETAEVAVEAALTGHLMFSTLHTNDAASAVTRLTDMGIEPFLISATLTAACAQRLLRRLCDCKTTQAPDKKEAELFKQAGIAGVDKLFVPAGCEKCDGSGYRGRMGIHELLAMNDDLREKIVQRASTREIKAVARKCGMRTLFEDAMDKARVGMTSVPEAVATAFVSE